MRAESFYNFAAYIEEVSDLRRYGGKSLHQQSHGESFISLFANRFEQGIYILDEPEAALSPQRQLSFLKIINDLSTSGQAQFLVATHSPILLSYPGAVLFDLDGDVSSGDRLSRDETRSRHARLSQLTREVLQASLRLGGRRRKGAALGTPMPIKSKAQRRKFAELLVEGQDLAGDLRGVESRGGERRATGASPPQGRRQAEAQGQIQARVRRRSLASRRPVPGQRASAAEWHECGHRPSSSRSHPFIAPSCLRAIVIVTARYVSRS